MHHVARRRDLQRQRGDVVMTHDPTEAARREMAAQKTWTTEELTRDFEVISFLAPFVFVRRRADGVEGLLEFRHSPRVYFGFTEA
jgi:hypothetical protein